MFYETTQTIDPGCRRSYKPAKYEDMTWSPSCNNFRSPSGSPQSYRRIIHPEDSDRSTFFSSNSSPTFPRKVFRDVWDDGQTSNHRFNDRPRLFKRVFVPNRWDDDDFGRTRSHVRQMARDFGEGFDSGKMDRDFDSDFHHHDRNIKSDIDEEFEKAAGRVHHIPIMVERRLEEMRSKFGKNPHDDKSPEYSEDSDEWQGPQVQRLKKNFERDEDFPHVHNRHSVPRVDPSRYRSYTSPMSSKWNPDSFHTLPSRKSGKAFTVVNEAPAAVPKSVFRSYSETHEDIPKHQQQQHTAAFRSHSDGHCPKTTYVTKISVNVPPVSNSNCATNNSQITEEMGSQSDNDIKSNLDDWDSHQNRHERVHHKGQDQAKTSKNSQDGPVSDRNEKDEDDPVLETGAKRNDEKPSQRTSLQQIAAVLQNVADLFIHVDSYNGTGRDKQYRFLDEMLTRCMLRLDDVDTEGREDIRSARKAAVMQVQSCIERLESKADECEANKNKKYTSSLVTDIRDEEKSENPDSVENDCQEKRNECPGEPTPESAPTDDFEHTKL